jgi:hypothetical protein
MASTKRKSSKSSKPRESEPVIIRTVNAPDGATIDFAVSPLWREFEQFCDGLRHYGAKPPAAVVDWIARHVTIHRINGGPWTPVILDPTNPLPA